VAETDKHSNTISAYITGGRIFDILSCYYFLKLDFDPLSDSDIFDDDVSRSVNNVVLWSVHPRGSLELRYFRS
jgi:hypothetical protein